MTPAQIQHVRDSNTIAAIVTTRNATFWLVDSKGIPGPEARYQLVEWDDANELCILQAAPGIRSDQFTTKMHINYAIIDELITLAQ